MVEMVIKAPAGFDVMQFVDIAGAAIRGTATKDSTAIDYDEIDLYDWARPVLHEANTYTIDANLIDFEAAKVFHDMQKICPQVEIYYEERGGASPFDGDTYDADRVYEALDSLYTYDSCKETREELGIHIDRIDDIFTELVNNKQIVRQ